MVIDQGDCGDGWESRPGTDTCYLFIDHDELSGSAAEGECEDRGGFLVSIRDREESNYLQGKTKDFISTVRSSSCRFFACTVHLPAGQYMYKT